MDASRNEELYNTLRNEWGLADSDSISEEDLLRLLTDRVIWYLEREPEPFFQMMYRLDISERKMNQALTEADPPHSLAKLIYERQIEKIISRRKYRSEPGNDPELGW